MNDTNKPDNQPKTRGREEGGTRKDARPVESAGGGCNVIVLETIDSDDIKNKLK